MRKWINLFENQKSFQTKDGRTISIKHFEEISDDGIDVTNVYASIDGQTIGSLMFDNEDQFVRGVDVGKEYRRLGIATALYDYLSQIIGYPVRPSSNLEPDGQAFWNDRNKITESDDWRDQINGAHRGSDLILYHGGPLGIDSFAADRAYNARGIWFTPSKEVAARYASRGKHMAPHQYEGVIYKVEIKGNILNLYGDDSVLKVMREASLLASKGPLDKTSQAKAYAEIFRKHGFVGYGSSYMKEIVILVPEAITILGTEPLDDPKKITEGSDDILALTHRVREELCLANHKTPIEMNSGQCDEFAEMLERDDTRFTAFELGNFYNHTTGDCDDATGFDLEMIHRVIPGWQIPSDFTWEEAFADCGMNWTGMHIWAYCETNRMNYDIENVDGVANPFDLEFFKRVFDHYRGQRK